MIEDTYYLDADIFENINIAMNGKIVIKDINDEVENLYYLYEYSDKIHIVTSNPRYPSMLNYIKTGTVTEAEMIEALFYNQVTNGEEII